MILAEKILAEKRIQRDNDFNLFDKQLDWLNKRLEFHNNLYEDYKVCNYTESMTKETNIIIKLQIKRGIVEEQRKNLVEGRSYTNIDLYEV